jgi:hypothetical protein
MRGEHVLADVALRALDLPGLPIFRHVDVDSQRQGTDESRRGQPEEAVQRTPSQEASSLTAVC